MGDIKKKKRMFDKPKKRWDKARIEEERSIKKKFGLKNKRELWKTETLLRKKKKDARALLALELEKRLKMEKKLIDSLAKYGLLSEKATIDDVLSLTTENFLERRLQTLAWRNGLAGTISQARQFIVHGHVSINGKKVNTPGYLVKKTEEDKISYYGKPMGIQEKNKKEIKKIALDKDKLKKEFEETIALGDTEAEEEKAMEEEIKEAESKGQPEETEKDTEEEAKEDAGDTEESEETLAEETQTEKENEEEEEEQFY